MSTVERFFFMGGHSIFLVLVLMPAHILPYLNVPKYYYANISMRMCACVYRKTKHQSKGIKKYVWFG